MPLIFPYLFFCPLSFLTFSFSPLSFLTFAFPPCLSLPSLFPLIFPYLFFCPLSYLTFSSAPYLSLTSLFLLVCPLLLFNPFYFPTIPSPHFLSSISISFTSLLFLFSLRTSTLHSPIFKPYKLYIYISNMTYFSVLSFPNTTQRSKTCQNKDKNILQNSSVMEFK